MRNPALVKLHQTFSNGSSDEDTKIVGGHEVEPHSYPHQVAIFIDGFYFCGGSLICMLHILI